MKQMISKLLHVVLPDYKIWELKNRNHIPSIEWSLSNLKRLGFDPVFAIDVGAFTGEWTQMFKKIFPAARVLMVEAQKNKEGRLLEAAAKLKDVRLQIALLGAESGKTVTFYINETVSSLFAEQNLGDFRREIYITETLDRIVFALEGQPSPDFIKLDVQGAELEVLKGSLQLLPGVQFILCEVSLIEINSGAPLISDVIAFMKKNGFVTYDICSFIRRPLDRALWQTDLLFIRETHQLNQNKNWG